MSGGHFDYSQYRIDDIVESIQLELGRQGKPKPKDDLYGDDEYFRKYPLEKFYCTYPIEIQEKMREAIKALRIARVYAHRVDWFLSGDDGEESFLNNLSIDLKQVDR